MVTKIEATGYGRAEHEPDHEMTAVGAGTPMGELLRRYWQPVCLTAELGTDPVAVRILGEDLVVFRDRSGQIGVLGARCCHRGTTLFYGRIEERGLRCCYHGWLFDVDGRCLEMPCEPAGSRRPSMVRQPWYPAREYRGLIFAYMGPPDRYPAFPMFDCIEDDAANPGKRIMASQGFASGGHVVVPELGIRTGEAVMPANWLQIFENVMDPYHVYILHMNISGAQFADVMKRTPEIGWEYTDIGIKAIQQRTLDDDRRFRRVTEAFVPNVRLVPTPAVGESGQDFDRGGVLSWVVPRDDTSTVFFSLVPVQLQDSGEPYPLRRSQFDGRNWEDLDPIEHRRMPGDYEAQVGQGPVTIHRDEHLVASDRGIMMLRKRWREQLARIGSGEDPPAIRPGPGDMRVTTEAGNFLSSEG